MRSVEDFNYYMDRRTWNVSPYQSFNAEKMCMILRLEDDEGWETVHELPVVFRPCEECNGTGKVVNPSIDASGLSSDDFRDDPDFAEDYKSGRYDITCNHCHGRRIVPEVDEENLNEDQKKLYELFLESERDRYAYARECAMERAMGA